MKQRTAVFTQGSCAVAWQWVPDAPTLPSSASREGLVFVVHKAQEETFPLRNEPVSFFHGHSFRGEFSSPVRYVSSPNRNTARPGWLEKVDCLIGIWMDEISFFYRSFTVVIHCSCTIVQRCRKFSIASHTKSIRSQSLLYNLYFERIP